MPAKSEKQLRAMAAAAHGKSTLGIPKAVGQKYLHETKEGKLKEAMEHLAKKRGK